MTEGDGDDTDLQIFCVSCSHPVNPKVALRHMERCYAKVSLQSQDTQSVEQPLLIVDVDVMFSVVTSSHSYSALFLAPKFCLIVLNSLIFSDSVIV